MQSCSSVFMWTPKLWTVSIIYSIPVSTLKHRSAHLKCVNLIETSSATLPCTAKTDFYVYLIFSERICSVLRQCYFVLRTKLLSLVHPEKTLENFLSLLNLWKKIASLLFHVFPGPPSMFSNRIYPSAEHEKQSLQEHCKGDTFRSIMLRQFLSYRPSLVFSGPVLPHAPSSCLKRKMTIFGHTSVSQVCMQDKAVFVRTRFLSAPPSTASRSLQITINQISIT